MTEKFDADWKRKLEDEASRVEENGVLLPGFSEAEESKAEIQNARKFQSIKPGFIVEVEDIREKDKKITIEIVGEPYQDTEHNWCANVIFPDGKDGPLHMIINLADYGIVPHSNGIWDSLRRPIKWYTKEDVEK
jgi:hypothetical protein